MTSHHVVILAAGQGKRMKSDLPKVLHPLAELTLLEHVVAAAQATTPNGISVVYGHGGEAVLSSLSHLDVDWVEQRDQLGTGHAVQQALPNVPAGSLVVVLNGDVPLIEPQVISDLCERVDAPNVMSLITVEPVDPSGYGRILRDGEGHVVGIVEHKDASDAERTIREINTGIMAIPLALLDGWLAQIQPNNTQGEYYLTDAIALAVRDGCAIHTVRARDAGDLLGVNDRVQLAELERRYQAKRAIALMIEGATLRDPSRVDVRGTVDLGRDVVIDVNVVLEGKVSLGDRVRVGPNTVVRDAQIGADTQILENCVIEQAEIGTHCRIGPYSRVRPETRLESHVHIGNFVEIKKSTIKDGSKVNHLSYVGDSEVGRDVNVGAGTITCNYDGANKHRTVIGDRAFIGSGTELVAPVNVAEGTTIAAGSTITRDTQTNVLAVARARQQSIKNWKRPVKKPTS